MNNSILDKYDWWASLKHGGLLIAPAKLAEFFPEQIEPLPRYLADRLRRDVIRLQDGDDGHLGALLDTVLETVLGLDKAWWLKGPVVDSRWGQKAVTGETIKPRRVWQPPAETGATLPVFTTDRMPGGAVTRIGVGRGRRAVSRVIEWLRKSKLKIGLLTNGHQWRLIHAGADYDAWAEWDIDFWFEEGQPGPQVAALRLLLGQATLSSGSDSSEPVRDRRPETTEAAGHGPAASSVKSSEPVRDRRLEATAAGHGPAASQQPTASQQPAVGQASRLLAAITASRQGQAELSSVLGERVRRAVELLIRESAPNIETLTTGNSQSAIRNSEIYIAATRVIMRCVIILFAEARELLPITNPRYHQSYGLQGLREQLDRRAGGRPERLRHSFNAWPRLLALFRLVYFGSDHKDLPTPRYGGGLFAPGDPQADDPVQRALTAFETIDPCPSDAAVYRMLALLTRSQVKVRQGRGATWVEAPVDFSDLSSEYIGILYEGLLDFELRRAETGEPLLFLNLGDQPVLPLSRLEAMDDKALAGLVKTFGKPAKPLPTESDSEEEDEEEEDGQLSTDENDEEDDDDDEPLMEDEEEGEENSELTIDDLQFAVHQRAQLWARQAVEAGRLVRRPRSRSREAQAAYEQAVGRMANRLIGRIILPGGWFLVRWGGTRKGSGTFYTRPQLAVPTVRRTLEPLVYNPAESSEPVRDRRSGAADTAGHGPTASSDASSEPVRDRRLEATAAGHGPTASNDHDTASHGPAVSSVITPSALRPRTPAEILALKVADPAMGSGSFLIAALRYLTEALYESLHVHGHIEAHGAGTLCRLPDGRDTNSTLDETLPVPPDHPDFEARLRAVLRRHVVERCLYGIDLNPLAVELARLALWVETMDRSLPFEFLDHKLKCGNALVGCWFDRFRDYPVMAWEREGGDKNHGRFVHHYHQATDRKGRPQTDKKGRPKLKGDVWTQAIKEKKNEVIKPEMIRWLQTQAGQTDFSQVLGHTPDGVQRRQQHTLAEMHATPAHEPERKADLYRRQVLTNAERQRLKLAFDAWCALWFWPGDRLDAAPLPRDFFNPGPEARQIIADLTAQHRFFHWELEFPDVFRSKEQEVRSKGENAPTPDSLLPIPYSGFDTIIGNPPWEILKPNSKEFFSNHDPLYRTYGKQEALRKQDELFAAHPRIESAWLAYNAGLKSMSNWSKYAFAPFGDLDNDGDNFNFTRSRARNETLHKQWRRRRAGFRSYADATHPFAYQGSADLNSYKMFTELAHALLTPGGRLGLIVPSGIYTDKGTSDLRTLFLEQCRWEWLFGFENRDGIFDIHRSFKFCPVIVTKGGQTQAINAAFMQRRLAAWEEAEQHAIPYRAEQVTKFSPTTRAILEVPTATDLAILEKLYANGVLLGDDSSAGWGIQYATEFHMTNDSKLFPPRPKWEAKGYRPDQYGHWLKGKWRPVSPPSIPPAGGEVNQSSPHRGELEGGVGQIFSRDGQSVIAVDAVEDVALPLYQGTMVGAFNPSKLGWISGTGLRAKWDKISWENKYFDPQFLMSPKKAEWVSPTKYRIGFRDIARSTDTRTMIASAIPHFPCGNKVPVLSLEKDEFARGVSLLAILNSLTFDWSQRTRQGSTSINFFILAEQALLNLDLLENSSIESLAASLGIPHIAFARWWIDVQRPNTPWHQLWAITPHERLRLRCILDAVVAHLYGLTAADFAWILRDCDHPTEKTRDNSFTRTLDPKGFWRVDKTAPPELRHPVLAQVAFHELKQQGLDAFLSQHNGEGWQLPESLRLSDYGLGHDARAREAQPVAAALGPRFLPWQLEQSVEESWAECARHAENLRLLLGGGEQAEGEAKAEDQTTQLSFLE